MKKRYILSILIIILFIVMLISCSDNSSNDSSENVASSTTTETSAIQNIFPIKYEVFGEPYTITGYKIEKDDTGNTIVKIHEIGILAPPGLSGEQQFNRIIGVFEIAGTIHEVNVDDYNLQDGIPLMSLSFSTSIIEYSCAFPLNISDSPEKITLKNGDTGDVIITFDTTNVSQSELNPYKE